MHKEKNNVMRVNKQIQQNKTKEDEPHTIEGLSALGEGT